VATDNTCVRVLQRAAELLGGEVPLAAALNVSAELISKWLAGHARPSTKAYFTALDIVTRHVEQQRRRVRRAPQPG
jgi:DNA-binding transcriptional regulator YiaG